MKTVVYTCPYVPAEWIAAHGLRPWRVVCSAAGPDAAAPRREGMCAYARSFLNEALSISGADAVVMTTLCDQMRRAFDVLDVRALAAFLLNVPATWQNDAAFDYYVEQLRRLGRFLTALGGIEPSQDRLAAVMTQYQTARQLLAAVRRSHTAGRWAQLVEQFGRHGPAVLDELCDSSRHNAIRNAPYEQRTTNHNIALALIGGPLLREDFDLYDIIEDNGGRIALDATETGRRGWPGEFDAVTANADPLTALAGAYFHGVKDPSRRPNDPLYTWLKAGCQSQSVRGVVCYRHVWCDAWHAELPRMRERLGLPVLDIEARSDGAAEQRTLGRILAFLEMLR